MTVFRTSAAGPDDERGATLIMLLITIIIVSITFTALLSYQSTALNAQTVLSDRRDLDLGADAALDVAVAQLQHNTVWGEPGQICGFTTAPGPTLTTWSADGDPVAVACYMLDANSGQGSTPRHVQLTAAQGTVTLATAEIKIYDLAGGAPFVSVERWDRLS